jgi:hypothetical protein
VSIASNARKVSLFTRVATQVATRQAGRSRTVQALMTAGRATARSLGRVAHQLWLEVTGTVFLFMSFVGGVALVREYGKYQAGHSTAARVVLAVCFTLTFAWFGVSSFWRVRKKRS